MYVVFVNIIKARTGARGELAARSGSYEVSRAYRGSSCETLAPALEPQLAARSTTVGTLGSASHIVPLFSCHPLIHRLLHVSIRGVVRFFTAPAGHSNTGPTYHPSFFFLISTQVTHNSLVSQCTQAARQRLQRQRRPRRCEERTTNTPQTTVVAHALLLEWFCVYKTNSALIFSTFSAIKSLGKTKRSRFCLMAHAAFVLHKNMYHVGN